MQEFERLARENLSALYGMAVRLTRDIHEAEDLMQETLMRAYRFFDRYEPGTNFKAWLFKILKNTFINRYHKTRRESEVIDFGASEEGLESLVDSGVVGDRKEPADPERIFMSGVLDQEIQEALEALPVEYRMVLLMAVVEEMSYKEIAGALECPIGTVMSRLHRARRLMQSRLVEYARKRNLTPPEERGNRPGQVINMGRFRRPKEGRG